MRSLIIITILLAATTALAFELNPSTSPKTVAPVAASPIDPAMIRQGGDTIEDAVAISIPHNGTGTTEGYTDNYDEVCPYENSTSPDVVYTFTTGAELYLRVDLYGSTYDTKVYMYDADMTLVACNDDYYPDYVSRIESVIVLPGVQYFIVIDGYGGAYGEYTLTVTDMEMCELDCPAGAELEGEPSLIEDYIDLHNSGCSNEVPEDYIQPITGSVFCGVSGWYSSYGLTHRDTDWFLYTIPTSGMLEVTGDAERATYMFELGPQDCSTVAVIQQATIGPCSEATMTIVGEPGSTVWFWVAPTTTMEDQFEEFDYILLSNIEGPSAIENHSLTEIKSLFH